jgi:hypothetical protein
MLASRLGAVEAMLNRDEGRHDVLPTCCLHKLDSETRHSHNLNVAHMGLFTNIDHVHYKNCKSLSSLGARIKSV